LSGVAQRRTRGRALLLCACSEAPANGVQVRIACLRGGKRSGDTFSGDGGRRRGLIPQLPRPLPEIGGVLHPPRLLHDIGVLFHILGKSIELHGILPVTRASDMQRIFACHDLLLRNLKRLRFRAPAKRTVEPGYPDTVHDTAMGCGRHHPKFRGIRPRRPYRHAFPAPLAHSCPPISSLILHLSPAISRGKAENADCAAPIFIISDNVIKIKIFINTNLSG
jgi:hypothetical protein